MIFANREHAGQLLAERLQHYKNQNPLVLAIPRGAVPMAQCIADMLNGELDVVLVRKLGAPGNPEFAVGAVEENGWAYVEPDAWLSGADEHYLAQIKEQELATIHARRKMYSPLRTAKSARQRIVIVVDDGLATGSTMIAALHALRTQHPEKLICAVPVAPPNTVKKVSQYCDELVCLHSPDDFRAVGQFYSDFHQVEDSDVITLLHQ